MHTIMSNTPYSAGHCVETLGIIYRYLEVEVEHVYNAFQSM